MGVVTTYNMKKQILLLSALLLSAVVTAFAQNSTSDDSQAIFSADSDVSVARGMSREAITFLLGVPSETVATDVWV